MSDAQVSRWKIAAFSLPSIPISALGLPIVVYLPPFYAQDMGLSLSVVGTVFMLARFWDVFTDPVLGVLSDRWPSRWGRRRHWIVISTPFLLIPAYMLFMPEAPVTWAYLAWWMFVLYIGWTLITICHMSWGAELSPDYDTRSTIQGAREFALIFGMFTVLALPAVIEAAAEGAGGAEKVAAMGWFIIILLPITVGIAVTQVGERTDVKPVAIDWRKAITVLRGNRWVQRLLIADLLVGVAPGITGALYLFFASYVFELPQYASLLLLIYFVAGFIGIPLWVRLSHWTGKHRALSIAMFYGALTLPLVIFFPRGEFWWLFAGNTAYGVAYGAGSFLLRSVMADVTDYDNLVTGEQRTGLYYSLLTMTAKVGAALAVGITYPLLDWIGFVAEPGVNSPETLNHLLIIYVSLPALFMAAAGLVMWGFPLDREKQREIRDKLKERDHMLADAAGAIAEVGAAGTIADEPARR